ncbi:MAG: methyltransferase domain-containing protein, partial [Oscillospiraceae bacterium]
MEEIKYQGSIDLSVKNNSHTIAFEYIANIANGEKLNILEVGCSSGYFGGALKSAGHQVWGIEPNKASALVARQMLDFVYEGYVENFINDYPNQKFDVISFGDVLEHLSDPSEVLKQCHELLVEGGAVVASVPNVAHISVRAMLLEGNWEYAELGILDRTHLRFFTRKTIQDLFYNTNFVVAEISAVKLSAETTATLCKMDMNEKAVSYIEAFAEDDCKEDFQYVLLAVPAGSRKGCGSQVLLKKPSIKVLGVAADIKSSHAEVRMIVPLQAWAAECHGQVNFMSIQDCDEESIAWADIVVIQRHIDLNTIRVLGIATRLGKKIIYETDDYLLELPDHLSHHKAGLAGHFEHIDYVLPQVDCITATTKRLAKQFERFSRPIAIIPNCSINDNLNPVDGIQWKSGRATLIIASTDTVLVDFILPAISALINRIDIDVKVVVIGPPGDAFERAGIPFERVPNMPYLEFKKFIRTVDNPIGVIPLDDSLFSSCKTAIKYFDYSMAGIPVACSNVPPYSDVITSEVNGILCKNDTLSWTGGIERLVQSSNFRLKIANQARSFVESEYSAHIAVKNWDLLLNKVQLNGFSSYSPPIIASSISQKFATYQYLRAHMLNYESY